MSATPTDFRPPNPPWQKLPGSADSVAYVTIYYSDDLSGLPVRCVTKPGDNKSDPNLETATYGMFSTCSKAMRSGVVTRGAKYLFFATARQGARVVAGYYRLHWYATSPAGVRDFALAADEIHFVREPVPFVLVDKRCGTDLSKPFRNMRLLTPAQCKSLREFLEEQEDDTASYLHEIDRLERFNLHYSGYRYVAWKSTDPFSWACARKYLESKQHNTEPVSNSTLSNQWKCKQCKAVVTNKALLKRCPNCGAIGTLRPN
jgi:hypothetical protein